MTAPIENHGAGDSCTQSETSWPGWVSTQPDKLTGCLDNLFQNGDLDFDGTPYWTEWPTSLTPGRYPSSFLEQFPSSNGQQYSRFHFQTDVALSEITCAGNTLAGSGGSGTTNGCTVPPQGPGGFYPYWTRVQQGGTCDLEFGNVSRGATFGRDAQYGTDQFATYGYPQFVSPAHNNPCR